MKKFALFILSINLLVPVYFPVFAQASESIVFYDPKFPLDRSKAFGFPSGVSQEEIERRIAVVTHAMSRANEQNRMGALLTIYGLAAESQRRDYWFQPGREEEVLQFLNDGDKSMNKLNALARGEYRFGGDLRDHADGTLSGAGVIGGLAFGPEFAVGAEAISAVSKLSFLGADALLSDGKQIQAQKILYERNMQIDNSMNKGLYIALDIAARYPNSSFARGLNIKFKELTGIELNTNLAGVRAVNGAINSSYLHFEFKQEYEKDRKAFENEVSRYKGDLAKMVKSEVDRALAKSSTKQDASKIQSNSVVKSNEEIAAVKAKYEEIQLNIRNAQTISNCITLFAEKAGYSDFARGFSKASYAVSNIAMAGLNVSLAEELGASAVTMKLSVAAFIATSIGTLISLRDNKSDTTTIILKAMWEMEQRLNDRFSVLENQIQELKEAMHDEFTYLNTRLSVLMRLTLEGFEAISQNQQKLGGILQRIDKELGSVSWKLDTLRQEMAAGQRTELQENVRSCEMDLIKFKVPDLSLERFATCLNQFVKYASYYSTVPPFSNTVGIKDEKVYRSNANIREQLRLFDQFSQTDFLVGLVASGRFDHGRLKNWPRGVLPNIGVWMDGVSYYIDAIKLSPELSRRNRSNILAQISSFVDQAQGYHIATNQLFFSTAAENSHLQADREFATKLQKEYSAAYELALQKLNGIYNTFAKEKLDSITEKWIQESPTVPAFKVDLFNDALWEKIERQNIPAYAAGPEDFPGCEGITQKLSKTAAPKNTLAILPSWIRVAQSIGVANVSVCAVKDWWNQSVKFPSHKVVGFPTNGNGITQWDKVGYVKKLSDPISGTIQGVVLRPAPPKRPGLIFKHLQIGPGSRLFSWNDGKKGTSLQFQMKRKEFHYYLNTPDGPRPLLIVNAQGECKETFTSKAGEISERKDECDAATVSDMFATNLEKAIPKIRAELEKSTAQGELILSNDLESQEANVFYLNWKFLSPAIVEKQVKVKGVSRFESVKLLPASKEEILENIHKRRFELQKTYRDFAIQQMSLDVGTREALEGLDGISLAIKELLRLGLPSAQSDNPNLAALIADNLSLDSSFLQNPFYSSKLVEQAAATQPSGPSTHPSTMPSTRRSAQLGFENPLPKLALAQERLNNFGPKLAFILEQEAKKGPQVFVELAALINKLDEVKKRFDVK